MPKKSKWTTAQITEIRSDLNDLVKHHGVELVRWAWNRMSSANRLRESLQKEKRRIERELEKVESKFR